MITLYAYGIGFLVYVFFCLFTFNAYSRKREETKHFVLILIYLYYSLLAGYMIYWVETKYLGGDLVVTGIETLVYMLAGGLVLYNYYSSTIKSKEDKDQELNESYGKVE